MSANILAIILDNVSPQFVGRCSSMLGLDRTITEKAMNAAIPAVLAGMARAVGRPDGARQLGNALSSEPGKLSTEPGNWFEGMAAPTVGAGQQPMTPAGSSILSPLLGSGGMKAINDAVSRYSGVAPGQASNVTNMAGLLAVNGLGRVQRETGLDSSGLAHALTSQAPQFAAAMPPGFSDILRNAEGSRPEATHTRPVEETRRRVDTQRAAGSDMTPMPNWLYWALGLLAILGIAWLLQPAFNEPQVATAPSVKTSPAPNNAAGQSMIAVGTPIYSSDGERLGDVTEVVPGPNNSPQAVRLDVGSPLGIGQKQVTMNVDQIERRGDRLVSKMTAAEARALPPTTK